jgi:DNA-binding CsgD family transcriptional regulator/tetratricopeptide (TPR) repeat protein
MGTLLEREAEMGRLRSLLESAANGRGNIAFVGGEAGIGKSTLVDTFISEVAGTARVAIGRCDALATPRALGPLVDIATGLGLASDTDRDALLGRLLADIRRHGVTVLVIEDAHWADDATVDLLAMLGRRVVELPLLLVVTYREDETAGDHPLRLAIGDLVTASSTVWLRLAPLSRDGVERLAEQSGVVAGDLYERTGGNPFFVTEALAAPSDSIPASVRLAVLARASRLDRDARSMLDAVSVVPGRAETWLVAAICDASSAAVDACIAAGALIAYRSTYAFRHELARLAIEADLADSVRRDLNQRAVNALVGRRDIDPARIAHHAEAAGDDEALATSARQALLLAAARTAHREAVRHGESALRVQQHLSADEVADLQTKLAGSLVQLARFDEADALLRRATEHWREIGDDRREAETLLVLSSMVGTLGRTAESMIHLGRAVELLERHEPGSELTLAYVRLASVHMLARERDPAVEWGERAIALATRQGDDSLLARALIETGTADVMDGRREGLVRIRTGIDLGRRRDLPGVVCLGLSQIGSGCGEMRLYDEAVPALIEGAAFGEQHNLETNRRYQVAWLARCRFDLGQWDEADALAREAIAGPRTVAIARFVGLNTLGWLRARRGDADVFPVLDEALAIARETRHLQRLWPCAIARAEAGWLDGALDPHVALLEEVLDQALRCRHGIAVGEIAVWLQRAGSLSISPSEAAEPFAAWISGDPVRASVGFRQMGCPYEAAHALAETGEVSSLRVALATFQRLGAAPMVERVSAELRGLGVRVQSAKPNPGVESKHPSGLTEREQEVVKLVAAGFTNPQIASSLYISRKTAEHHVSNILMKFGVTTRAEAAAAATRLGVAG